MYKIKRRVKGTSRVWFGMVTYKDKELAEENKAFLNKGTSYYICSVERI